LDVTLKAFGPSEDMSSILELALDTECPTPFWLWL